MKHTLRTRASALLCVLLSLATVLGLCGCPSPSDGGGTTTTTTTTTTTGSSTGNGQNPDAPIPTTYGNGGAIAGTGDRLAAGAPVLTAPSFDAAAAIEKSYSEIRNLFRDNDLLEEGLLLSATGGEPVKFGRSSARTYDGNGAVIISAAGFLFDACMDITLRNITLVGPVVIRGGKNITLENVKIVAEGKTALSVSADAEDICLRGLRAEGKVAVENASTGLLLLESYLGFTDCGLSDLSAKDLYLRDCRFVGTDGAAIKTASDNAEIRKCTVTTQGATAVEIGEAKNVLLAECIIRDAQRSVRIIGAENSVLVRNSLVSVEAGNGKHIYVVDNAMGGKLYASDINYLLADGNTYPDDEYNHVAEQIGITNSNGNTLMDVDKRLSAGADENLLPHVDRDQFFDEERRTVVRDPDGEELDIARWVLKKAETEEIVIVAPGAYTTKHTYNFYAKHSNTTVYAYGALSEGSAEGIHDTVYGYTRVLNTLIYFQDTDNITLKGGTYGYEFQGHAQGRVTEKLTDKQSVRLYADPGFLKDIGLSNEKLFGYTTYAYRPDEPFNYGDLAHDSAELQEDGTVIMKFSREKWEKIRVGDVITTRPSDNFGGYTAESQRSADITYYDVTIFGAMSTVCFHESSNRSAITYYRCADTYRSGMKISEEVYNEYKELERAIRKRGQTQFTYELSYDEEHGCYRGPAFRNASLDGVHVGNSAGGSQIICSLFERIGDDGTNQHSGMARLSSIHDNGDGTLDLIYKGNLSQYWYNYAPNMTGRWAHGFCTPFTAGQNIVVYTANGGLVLDGTTMTAAVSGPKVTNDLETGGQYPTIDTYRVKVKINEYHEDVLADYAAYLDPYSASNSGILPSKYNGPEEQYKVYVHNNSQAAAGCHIDNTKVSCGRARAALIKSSDVTIENCTYEHIGLAAVGVYYETLWGESAMSRNVTVRNNVISHGGYRSPDATSNASSPITVEAPGKLNLNKTALYSNVVITGNIIKDRATRYAISVRSVSDLVIENNDLGTINEMGLPAQKATIRLEYVAGAKIEGNLYPDKTMPIKSTLTLSVVKGLTGADVDNGDMFPEYK